jgi:hypothetical protein
MCMLLFPKINLIFSMFFLSQFPVRYLYLCLHDDGWGNSGEYSIVCKMYVFNINSGFELHTLCDSVALGGQTLMKR